VENYPIDNEAILNKIELFGVGKRPGHQRHTPLLIRPSVLFI